MKTRKGKAWLCVAVFLVVSLMMTTAAFAVPTLSLNLQANPLQVAPGETFTVSCVLDNPAGDNVGAYDMTVTFDATKVDYVSCSLGASNVNVLTDEIALLWWDESGGAGAITGDDVLLFDITFSAKTGAVGLADFAITTPNTAVFDGATYMDYAPSVNGVSVTIEGESSVIIDWDINGGYLSGIPVSTTVDGFKAGIHVPAGYTVNVKKADGNPALGTAKIATAMTVEILDDTSTLYAAYTVVIYGDCTGDGTINAMDLLALKKHLLSQLVMTGAYREAGNTNKDAFVNALDLLVLKKHILGQVVIVQ